MIVGELNCCLLHTLQRNTFARIRGVPEDASHATAPAHRVEPSRNSKANRGSPIHNRERENRRRSCTIDVKFTILKRDDLWCPFRGKSAKFLAAPGVDLRTPDGEREYETWG